MPSGPDLLLNVCPRGGGDAAAAHAEMAPDEQVPTVRLRRNRGRARYQPPLPRPPQRVASSLWGRDGRAALLQAGASSEVAPSQGCGQVPSRPASGGAWIGGVQGPCLPIPRDVILCLSEYSWALHEPLYLSRKHFPFREDDLFEIIVHLFTYFSSSLRSSFSWFMQPPNL